MFSNRYDRGNDDYDFDDEDHDIPRLPVHYYQSPVAVGYLCIFGNVKLYLFV